MRVARKVRGSCTSFCHSRSWRSQRMLGSLCGGLDLPLLVAPVGGDPLLGEEVHLEGADLHLEGLPALVHHRRVQRLVEVRLGHRDVVLEAPGDGAPAAVHDAERRVGVLEARGDDAEGEVVVELRDVDALAAQLLVDRVVALDAEADLGLDAVLAQGLGQLVADALGGLLAELQLLGDLAVQLGELVRVEVVEGEVLEVPLDPRHPQAVGDGGVDLERLARDPPPRLGRQVVERLHVVQAVGELDDDHPDVLGRGQDHLAEGLGLRLVVPHVGVAADLGHPVDQLGELGPEGRLQHLAGGERVLQDVVEEPDGDADLVELEVGEEKGDLQGVGQVGLAGLPQLVLVHLRREVVDGAQEGDVHLPLVGLEPGEHVLEADARARLHRRGDALRREVLAGGHGGPPGGRPSAGGGPIIGPRGGRAAAARRGGCASRRRRAGPRAARRGWRRRSRSRSRPGCRRT